MTTLFGHVAALVRNREDVATKGLHYVLSRSVEARRLMQDVLRAADPSLPMIVNYQYQPGGSDGEGRPDMRGATSEGTFPLLIESKIWAGLTDHQPVSYLKRLPEPGLLLFVAPEDRVRPLKWELAEKLDLVGLPTAAWVDAGTPQVVWSRIAGSGKVLAITPWQKLLIGLRDAIVREGGVEVTVSDIDQLRGFIDTACGATEQFLPFLSEQVTGREIPQFIASMKKVVGRALEAAGNELGFNRRTWKPDTLEAYGADFEFKGAEFWFGYYQVAWRRFGASPLWLEVWQKSNRADAMFGALATLAGESGVLEIPAAKDSNWYVPVALAAHEHEDVVFQDVMATLRRLRTSLENL